MSHHTSRRWVLSALVVPLVLGSAPPGVAAPPQALVATSLRGTASDPSGTITWAVEPAGQDGPDGRVSLRHVVEPGGAVADQVAVTNFSDQPASFRVYAGDGIVTSAGDFDLMPAGMEPVDGGSWVTFGTVEGSEPGGVGFVVEVAAGATVTVPLEIAVPADATPGDHPAGVVAELVDNGASGVQVASRVGVRIHLRVSGDVVARVVPDSVRATWEPSWNPFAPGTVRIEYVLANEGNVRLGARAVASLAGPFDMGSDTAELEQREILPSQEVVVETEVSAWPLVRSDGEITVTPVVVGDDEVEAALAAVSLPVSVWTIPWAQLALLALLLGAVVLARRLRRRTAARIEARVQAAIASLAAPAGGSPVPAGDGLATVPGEPGASEASPDEAPAGVTSG